MNGDSVMEATPTLKISKLECPRDDGTIFCYTFIDIVFSNDVNDDIYEIDMRVNCKQNLQHMVYHNITSKNINQFLNCKQISIFFTKVFQ